MTALSPVFFPGVTVTSAQKEEIYRLLPRVQPGGSTAATVAVGSSTSVVLDNDRLYANVDEFLFRPEMPGTTRVDNTLVDAQRLRRARFFLTANSRGPRVERLWPAPDRSLAGLERCDQAHRLRQARRLLQHDGHGDQREAVLFPAGRLHQPHNRLLDPRAQSTTLRLPPAAHRGADPGYGGNFLTKWALDRDQVLTEVFDYIRCVNMREPDARLDPLRRQRPGRADPDRTTQGFGRFFTVSQAGLHFICSQEGDTGILTGNDPPNDKLDPPSAS